MIFIIKALQLNFYNNCQSKKQLKINKKLSLNLTNKSNSFIYLFILSEFIFTVILIKKHMNIDDLFILAEIDKRP